MKTRIQSLLVLFCLLFSTFSLSAKEEQRKCEMKRDYWLYTPDKIDPAKTYWLVVGVHGFKGQGKGAAGLSGWVNQLDNVIVIGPTFPSTGPYYQDLQGNVEKQLIDIQKQLQKEFKLHPKMFLYGFSGGSQFVHRFAEKNGKLLCGVSAHSGGTWSNIANKSPELLWTFSCGLKDTAISIGAKMTRIDEFRAFYANANREKFSHKPFVTDAGHSPAAQVRDGTLECFRTVSTGLFDYQRKATAAMKPLEREAWIAKNSTLKQTVFDDGKKKYTLSTNADGWVVSNASDQALKSTRLALDALVKK